MPPAGFETAVSACERPQTHALDGAATGRGYLDALGVRKKIISPPFRESNPRFLGSTVVVKEEMLGSHDFAVTCRMRQNSFERPRCVRSLCYKLLSWCRIV